MLNLDELDLSIFEEEQELIPLDPLSEEEQRRHELAERLASVYLVNAEQLLENAALEPDWLVKNAIPKESICYFSGLPGVCKSWLAYDLALAVLQRRDWINLGIPLVPADACVLLLNFDNPYREVQRRFLRLGLEKTGRLFTHSFGAHTPPASLPATLQFPSGFEALELLVYYKRPVLIVVDSFRQAHTEDESNSQEMALIMGQLKRLTLWGASVIIVHHTTKDGKTMRGSTEIAATADAITDVEKEAEVSLATWKKTRGWDPEEPTVSVFIEDEGDRTYVRGGKSVTSVLVEAGGTCKRNDIGELMGISATAAKKLVDSAIARGSVREIRSDGGGKSLELVRRGAFDAPENEGEDDVLPDA